jgi:DNA-binding XRE family transcriptional regulator
MEIGMKVQTIETERGDNLVVLSRRDYDALLARAGDEDAEDRMTLLIAAEARGEEPLPEPVSAAILRGDCVLRALRNWRGISQAELSLKTGVPLHTLNEIEQRQVAGSPDVLSNIATQLKVPVGWLG